MSELSESSPAPQVVRVELAANIGQVWVHLDRPPVVWSSGDNVFMSRGQINFPASVLGIHPAIFGVVRAPLDTMTIRHVVAVGGDRNLLQIELFDPDRALPYRDYLSQLVAAVSTYTGVGRVRSLDERRLDLVRQPDNPERAGMGWTAANEVIDAQLTAELQDALNQAFSQE